MAFDWSSLSGVPKAYSEYKGNFENYQEPFEDYKYKPKSDKRGAVDRLFDMIQVGNYAGASALYNVTDDDPNTTMMEGLKEGIKAGNPFGKGNEVGEKVYSDVIGNLGWNPEKLPGKIAKGAAGLALDIGLDPLSYVNPFSAASKVIGGTGSVVKGGKLVSMSMDDATTAMHKVWKGMGINIDEIPKEFAEREIANLQTSMNQKMFGIRKTGEDFKLGGDNLPFANKIKVPGTKKTLDQFTVKLADAKKLREIGDKTIAPYYNKLTQTLKETKTLKRFKKNLDIYELAKIDPAQAAANYKIIEMGKGISVKGMQQDIKAFKETNEFQELYSKMQDKEGFIKAYEGGAYKEIMEGKAVQAEKIDNFRGNKNATTKLKEEEKLHKEMYTEFKKEVETFYADGKSYSTPFNIRDALKAPDDDLLDFLIDDSMMKGVDEFGDSLNSGLQEPINDIVRDIARKYNINGYDDLEKKLSIDDKFVKKGSSNIDDYGDAKNDIESIVYDDVDDAEQIVDGISDIESSEPIYKYQNPQEQLDAKLDEIKPLLKSGGQYHKEAVMEFAKSQVTETGELFSKDDIAINKWIEEANKQATKEGKLGFNMERITNENANEVIKYINDEYFHGVPFIPVEDISYKVIDDLVDAFESKDTEKIQSILNDIDVTRSLKDEKLYISAMNDVKAKYTPEKLAEYNPEDGIVPNFENLNKTVMYWQDGLDSAGKQIQRKVGLGDIPKLTEDYLKTKDKKLLTESIANNKQVLANINKLGVQQKKLFLAELEVQKSKITPQVDELIAQNEKLQNLIKKLEKGRASTNVKAAQEKITNYKKELEINKQVIVDLEKRLRKTIGNYDYLVIPSTRVNKAETLNYGKKYVNHLVKELETKNMLIEDLIAESNNIIDVAKKNRNKRIAPTVSEYKRLIAENESKINDLNVSIKDALNNTGIPQYRLQKAKLQASIKHDEDILNDLPKFRKYRVMLKQTTFNLGLSDAAKAIDVTDAEIEKLLQLNPKLLSDFSSDVNKTAIQKYNKVHNRKIGYTFDDAVDYTHHKMARDLDAFEAEKINEEAIKEKGADVYKEFTADEHKAREFDRKQNIAREILNPADPLVYARKSVGKTYDPKNILEVSSNGDKRFSALNAKVKINGKTDTIENHYQLAKRFKDEAPPKNWKDAKGRKPDYFVFDGKNYDPKHLRKYYHSLWKQYLDANPKLVEELKQYGGFTDQFAKMGSNNQARSIAKYMDDFEGGVTPKDILNDEPAKEVIEAVKPDTTQSISYLSKDTSAIKEFKGSSKEEEVKILKVIKQQVEELSPPKGVEPSQEEIKLTVAKFLDKRMNEMGLLEVKHGKLDAKQLKANRGKYVTHMRTPEAVEYIKKHAPEMYDSSGGYNPSALWNGYEKQFNKSKKFKTIEEGNRIMKQVTGVDKWLEDDLVKIFEARSLLHNRLIYHDEMVKAVRAVAGVDYVRGHKIEGYTPVVSYVELNDALNKKYNGKVPAHLFDEDHMNIDRNFFSPNNAYIPVTEEQITKILSAVKTKSKPEGLDVFQLDNTMMKRLNKESMIQKRAHMKDFVNVYDKFLSVYKNINTTITPGFHAQNALSNEFQSYLAKGATILNPNKLKTSVDIFSGKTPSKMIDINGQMLSHNQIKLLAEKYGILDNTFYKADVRYGTTQPGSLKRFGVKGEYDPTDVSNFKPYRIGGEIGGRIEGSQRLTLFVEELKDGKSIQDAVETVNKYMFDYSDLTDFEKDTMKRIIPFYTFMRKNIPMELEAIIENPTKFINVDKAFDEVENMSNEDEVPDSKRTEWRKDYVQMPFKLDGQSFGVNPQLPYQQLDRVELRKILGQTTPLIKTPIEAMAGEYLYTGIPIKSPGDYLASQFTPTKAPAIAQNKEGIEKLLYLLGQTSGFPTGTL